MKPSQIAANERLKLISSGLFQLGTALFAASVVKTYVENTFSLEGGSWFLTAGILMSVGWKVLYLMEPES